MSELNTTIVNTSLNDNSAKSLSEATTVLNVLSNARINLKDKVIDHEFIVGNKIEIFNSGEADLYECIRQNEHDSNNNGFILKVYHRQNGIKTQVIEILKNLHSDYLPQIVTSGFVENRPFVIMPRYKTGSLRDFLNSGKTFNIIQIKQLVKHLNESLKVIHDNNIIHKDVKPDNIILNDDLTPRLIDFGISSLKSHDEKIVYTNTGLTPTYLAPETVYNCFSIYSDYYALGITIYETFCGKTPYENVPKDKVVAMAATQNIPFSNNFPEELKQLIIGLTYRDIGNQEDVNNPNRRWTYNEIEKWLLGEKQVTPGSSNTHSDAYTRVSFRFLDKSYKDSQQLLLALFQNWNEGIKFVGRNILTEFYRNNNEDAKKIKICEDACEEMSQDTADLDFIFAKTLYKLDSHINQLFWKGECFANLYEYGQRLVFEANLAMSNNSYNKTIVNSAKELLKNKILLAFAHKHQFDKELFVSVIKENETLNKYKPLNEINSALRLGYSLTNSDAIAIGGITYNSIADLEQYLNDLYHRDLKLYSTFKKQNQEEVFTKAQLFIGERNHRLTHIFKDILDFANGDIVFESWEQFDKYIKSLWHDNRLLELYALYRKILPDLEGYNNIDEEQSSNTQLNANIITSLKNQIATMYRVDEYFFKSETDFLNYLSNLKDLSLETFNIFCNTHQKIYNKIVAEGKILPITKCGDIIPFGSYYIDNEYQKSALFWKVLKVESDKILLITQDVIAIHEYDNKSYKWDRSVLRTWLNEDFLHECFSNNEQNKILVTKNETLEESFSNQKNVGIAADMTTNFGQSPAFITSYDKVFIPCFDDVQLIGEKDIIKVSKKLQNNKIIGYWSRTAQSNKSMYYFALNQNDGKASSNLVFEKFKADIKLSAIINNATIGVRPMIWLAI